MNRDTVKSTLWDGEEKALRGILVPDDKEQNAVSTRKFDRTVLIT